jgi:predicted transcriptional regulator/transcriptional regulator with XRE-family HTH domain
LTLQRNMNTSLRPPRRSVLGSRIRDRRRSLRMTQAALAARVGISASYLNLIEANKRSIGGALLKRIGDALEMPLESLDGAAERRLLDELDEIAGAPMLSALALTGSTSDLAGRHGAWAHALVVLHRAWRDRDDAVHALSNRLSQDPFLGDAVHRMLTRVAAIRSAAEILGTNDDLAPDEQRRFAQIASVESERLSDVAQALATFFDKDVSDARPRTPIEEVDDFLLDRGNHFAELESVADSLRAACGDVSERSLADYLTRVQDVSTGYRHVATAPHPVRTMAEYDAQARTLVLDETLPAPTRRFELARLAADLFHQGAPLNAAIDASPQLRSAAARRRARRVLSSYVAGAVLLPYVDFQQAAVSARYDIEHLGRRFDASFEQVCHRLTTLQRPGAEGIPFGLMRVDAAGYVTKRLPLPRLLLPRYGNACPIWALYAAFQTPGEIVRQIAEFPTGDRFLFVACAIDKVRPAYAMPRRLMSVMLACDVLHADRTIYGEGLRLSSAAKAVPVGSNCRLCVRSDCAYREEDPIVGA